GRCRHPDRRTVRRHEHGRSAPCRDRTGRGPRHGVPWFRSCRPRTREGGPGMSQVAFPPEVPIGDWFESGNEWLKANFGIVFDAIGAFVRWAVEVLSGFFMEPAAGQLA